MWFGVNRQDMEDTWLNNFFMMLMDNEEGKLSGKGVWINCGYFKSGSFHLDVSRREDSVY